MSSISLDARSRTSTILRVVSPSGSVSAKVDGDVPEGPPTSFAVAEPPIHVTIRRTSSGRSSPAEPVYVRSCRPLATVHLRGDSVFHLFEQVSVGRPPGRGRVDAPDSPPAP
jgi:hypothetical protein